MIAPYWIPTLTVRVDLSASKNSIPDIGKGRLLAEMTFFVAKYHTLVMVFM